MTKSDACISFDSPIGVITIESRNEKIVSLVMGHKAKSFGSSKVLTEAKKQVQAYLAGKLQKFDLPVQLDGTEFQKSVWKVIAKINFGKTVTYGEIAAKIGNPQAARAIGGAVGANPVPLIVGCHRVLGSAGRITGYSGGSGIPTKEWLLELEGIEYR
jgi:methylated-DNA-[protein]-cysteine S-methyltransferase